MKTIIDKYLTIDEVGEILDVSRQAVFEWVKGGKMKYYQIGRGIRIRPDDVISYLENLGNPPKIEVFKKNIEIFLLNKYEG